MLWSGLVSWVGASYRVNLIAPFPLGWTCPRKIEYVKVGQNMSIFSPSVTFVFPFTPVTGFFFVVVFFFQKLTNNYKYKLLSSRRG